MLRLAFKRLNGRCRAKLVLLILLFPFVQTFAAKTLTANNPILKGADPHAILVDGIFYVYPTSGPHNKFYVYSSSDLLKWQQHSALLDFKKIEDLVEHLPVLGGNAHPGLKAFRMVFKGLYHRSHFDGFGTGAEYGENFEHIKTILDRIYRSIWISFFINFLLPAIASSSEAGGDENDEEQPAFGG